MKHIVQIHAPAVQTSRRSLSQRLHSRTWQAVAVLMVGTLSGVYLLGATQLPQRLLYLAVLLIIFPFLAMIVGSLRRLLLAVILIEIPFQLDIYFFHQEAVASTGAISGLNISVTTLALAVLYALWFAGLMTRSSLLPRTLWRTSLPLLSYVAIVMLSATVAIRVDLAIYEIWLLVQSFLLYFYIVATVNTRRDVLFVVAFLLVGLFLESMIMVWLRIVGADFSIGNVAARIHDNGRVAGTLGSPNLAASYLALLLAPALSLLLTRLSSPIKWVATLVFSLGGLSLIFTLSRGGWITFSVSVCVLCVLAWKRGWLPPMVPLVTISIMIALLVMFQETIVVRIFGDDAGSAQSRLPLISIAWRMIMDAPIMGVGANNFAMVLPPYVTPEFNDRWLYTVHNKYLLVWAETGIGGLAAFLWFLLATIRRGWVCWQFQDRMLSPIALAFAAATAGHMIHMAVDIFNSRPQVQMLWVIAAIIAAIRNMGSSASLMNR